MLDLTDLERQVLNAPVIQTRLAIQEFQNAQAKLEHLRQQVVTGAGAVEKVFRAVLTLKGANPDAYDCEWSPESDEVKVLPKEDSAPQEPPAPVVEPAPADPGPIAS